MPNVTMEPLNVRKNKGIIECEKSKIICDVGNAQCEDGNVKCEKKKKKEPLNVTKILPNFMLVLLNVKIKPSNVIKKKIKKKKKKH